MLTEYVCILRPENSDIPTGSFNVKTEMACCNNTLHLHCIYTVFGKTPINIFFSISYIFPRSFLGVRGRWWIYTKIAVNVSQERWISQCKN